MSDDFVFNTDFSIFFHTLVSGSLEFASPVSSSLHSLNRDFHFIPAGTTKSVALKSNQTAGIQESVAKRVSTTIGQSILLNAMLKDRYSALWYIKQKKQTCLGLPKKSQEKRATNSA